MRATGLRMKPTISVIVCTHNRRAQLERCLEALLRIKSDHIWELIIVKNACTDGTADFLKALPSGPVPIKVVDEPLKGGGRARNRGLEVAEGRYLGFVDDDCYVTEDYIDAMIAAFNDHPEAGFIGGRILLYDKSDLHLTIDEHEAVRSYQPYTFMPAGAIHGANVAFRREVLDRIGGFNNDFGAGASYCTEDTVAQANTLWAGFAGAFDPRPVVFHHHGRKTKDDLRKLFKIYDAGVGSYYAHFLLRKDTRRTFAKGWLDVVFRNIREATLDPGNSHSHSPPSPTPIAAAIRYTIRNDRRTGQVTRPSHQAPE